MTPSPHQPLRAGDAGGAGRLAAHPAGADLGLGVEDLLIADLRGRRRRIHSSARRHFVRFTGRLISMALAMVDARLAGLRPARG